MPVSFTNFVRAFFLTNHIIHFFLQLVPETALVILFGYAFVGKKVDKKYFISSGILAVLAYLVIFGLTPKTISQQVASLLIFIASSVILILLNKFDSIKVIFSTLIVLVFFVITEILNLFVMENLLGITQDKIKEIFESYTLERWLYGLPNLIFKIIVIIIIYLLRTGRKKNATINKNIQ